MTYKQIIRNSCKYRKIINFDTCDVPTVIVPIAELPHLTGVSAVHERAAYNELLEDSYVRELLCKIGEVTRNGKYFLFFDKDENCFLESIDHISPMNIYYETDDGKIFRVKQYYLDLTNLVNL